MLWTGTVIDVERDVLIVFDLLLVVVIGLLLYSLSARDPATRPALFDRLQLALAVSALLIDALVLLAVTGRIAEYGATPNKAAALGENVILLANLAWTAFLLVGFLRHRRPLPATGGVADPLPRRLRRLGLDGRPDLPAGLRLRVGGRRHPPDMEPPIAVILAARSTTGDTAATALCTIAPAWRGSGGSHRWRSGRGGRR